MLYHPIASVLVQILEKKLVRYSKDFYEISHIQSSTGTAERFASISVSTFAKSIKESLRDGFNGTLYTSTLLGTLDEEKLGERPIKLLFNPIDNFSNFSRGIQNFGVSFLLQEQTRQGWVDVFSLVYSFDTQEIIYSDEVGSYIKGRPLKPVIRKNPKLAVIACNTPAIRKNPNIVHKFKQLLVSSSLVSDFHLLAKGKIDGIYYEKTPVVQVLPLMLLAKSLRVSVPSFTELSSELSGKGVSALFINKDLKDAIFG